MAGRSRLFGSFGALVFAFSVLVSGLRVQAVSAADLLSRWPANGNANDVVGDNNGSLLGGTTFDKGVLGRAFTFAAPGDMVEVPYDPSLDLETFASSTFEGWFKSAGGSFQDALIVAKHTCSVATGWFFTTDQGCFVGDHYIGGYGVAGPDLDDNNVHHFACVKEGTAYREYVDGLLVSEDTGPESGTLNVAPLQIGSITTGSCNISTHQLAGFVDEVRLYDFSLATEQIQSIYEGKRKIFMSEPQ